MSAMDSVLTERKITSDADVLEAMIEWVEKGRWCRDKLVYRDAERGVTAMCALGMIGQAVRGSPHNHGGFAADRIKQALVATIGDDYPSSSHRGQKINDGLVRGHASNEAKIATYNNTRPTERDITGWFRRALKKLQGP